MNYPCLRHPGPFFSDRIARFLERTNLPTPFLVMDVAEVACKYLELRRTFPDAPIYYAVKANPLPGIIGALADLGSCFDVASTAEIEQCLAIGVSPRRFSFGNTIKRASAIAAAHAGAGIDLFLFDSAGELGEDRYQRAGRQSDSATVADAWQRRRLAIVTKVRLRAGDGVRPAAPCPSPWPHSCTASRFTLAPSRRIPGNGRNRLLYRQSFFDACGFKGSWPETLNIGGGIPRALPHGRAIRSPEYGAAIGSALYPLLRTDRLQIIVEPGRCLVADAGLHPDGSCPDCAKSYARQQTVGLPGLRQVRRPCGDDG